MSNVIYITAARYFRSAGRTQPDSRVKQIIDRAHELKGLRLGDKVRTQQGWAFVVEQTADRLTISCRGIRKTLLPHHIVPATPEDGIA